MPFVAPEIIQGEPASKQSDIYSFGMFLVELLCPLWTHPWAKECRPMFIAGKVANNERPKLPSQCVGLSSIDQQTFVGLIKQCWIQNPLDRIKVADIVQEIELLQEKISPSQQTETGESKEGAKATTAPATAKFRFPEDTEEVQHHMLNLSIHQGSALETFGDITASCVSEGTDLDPDLAVEISTQASIFDGTNACVFNSIAIADWILKNEKTSQLPNNSIIVQKAVEEIIATVPKLINDVRDPSSRYTVEDALLF